MSRRDQAKDLAARFSSAREQESAKSETPKKTTARTKRVRRTVDLPVARHHALREWCANTAIQLGVAQVTGQDVMNALVARLLRDETLARKIRQDLEEELE